jgi:L-ascorbate metabolism protein UlaG (beta-lactamase superfamily)
MIKKQRLPLKYGGRYYNHSKERTPTSWLKRLYALSRELKYLYHGFKQFKKLGVTQPSSFYNASSDDGIWWIGHATFIIKMSGIVIITDPVLASLPLVHRLVEPAINLNEIPHVDYVLISHNHWDHLDQDSINILAQKNQNITLLLPAGNLYKFQNTSIKCLEFNWWQKIAFNNLNFVFLPAHHWSQSTLFDRNKSLWGSWLIQGQQSVYFAGDSAYASHYQEIAALYNIDYALLPIGPCEPRELMCKSHMGPEEALAACIDLKAKFMIPMHWGTFSFGLDDRNTAKNRLIAAHTKQQIAKVILLEIGQSIDLSLSNFIQDDTVLKQKSLL